MMKDHPGKLKMYISQILQKREYFTSDNAAKALEIISSQQPDIILTDIRMPGKDGLYISSFVHNNFPDKIVILITGFLISSMHRQRLKPCFRLYPKTSRRKRPERIRIESYTYYHRTENQAIMRKNMNPI